MIMLFYREVYIRTLKMELLVRFFIIFTIYDDISINKLKSSIVENFTYHIKLFINYLSRNNYKHSRLNKNSHLKQRNFHSCSPYSYSKEEIDRD